MVIRLVFIGKWHGGKIIRTKRILSVMMCIVKVTSVLVVAVPSLRNKTQASLNIFHGKALRRSAEVGRDDRNTNNLLFSGGGGDSK